MKQPIDRGFQRTAFGLIHYREVRSDAAETPLVLIHGGPGSSAGLAPMIAGLGANRHVIAPDLPGNGDSDPPPASPTDVLFYAEAIAEFLGALKIDRFDLYGHHSGAQIACELSIARPRQVRRLVLDGVALFSAAQRSEFSARYAPPVTPRADGEHLLWAWDFVSNLTQFFPHYRRDESSRLNTATVLPAEAITNVAIDLLKVWPTYHLLYGAAFNHDVAERLHYVTAPTLLLEIEGDPLARYVAEAAKILPQSRIIRLTRANRVAAIEAFLAV